MKVKTTIMLGIISSAAAFCQQSPNIVFILADDLGWADIPAYGNRFNQAPNLSELAAEGMLFTNAYASSPVCSPSRASILTGQYPVNIGINDWIPGHYRPYEEVITPLNEVNHLPTEIYTLGEVLQEEGYATAFFGKWHLGREMDYHPLNQGFDEANTGMGYYNVNFVPPRPESDNKIFSERLSDFGTKFIEENAHHPFFLFLSHWDVHVQLDADRDLISKYLDMPKQEAYPCNAIYAAMIEHLDRSVGAIVDKLEEEGISENTILIFYSDNGGLISRFDMKSLVTDSKSDIYKDHPLQYIATSNSPLKGEKGSLYEGGIREPLIIKWPLKVKAGSINHSLVNGIDFFPTILDIIEVTHPPGQLCDGISLLPVITSNSNYTDRVLYWHYPVYHHDVPSSAIRKGDWKLIKNLINDSTELYNLSVDLGEEKDLSEIFPLKEAELSGQLDQWLSLVNAPMPKPNLKFNNDLRNDWAINPYK